MNSKITCNSCNVSCPISFLLIYLSTGISLGHINYFEYSYHQARGWTYVQLRFSYFHKPDNSQIITQLIIYLHSLLC